MRSFKVATATQWDEVQCKYVPRPGGEKTVEISSRTAVEDVTDVEGIADFFSAS